MPKYFFDIKGGLLPRDHVGKLFANDEEAIVHAENLARRISGEMAEAVEQDLYISILNSNSFEVH